MKAKDLKEILAEVDDNTPLYFDLSSAPSDASIIFIDIEEAETGCAIDTNSFDITYKGYDSKDQLSPNKKIVAICFGNDKTPRSKL
jgi:hypothetical protein